MSMQNQCCCFIFTVTVLQVLDIGKQHGTCWIETRPIFVFVHFLEIQHYANDQILHFCNGGLAKHTHWAPQFSDRMALCTPDYAGIKQALLPQAPHRIPNTMEPTTSGLDVTSFLQGSLFLWCISLYLLALSVSGAQCNRSPAPAVCLCMRVYFRSPTLRTKSL